MMLNIHNKLCIAIPSVAQAAVEHSCCNPEKPLCSQQADINNNTVYTMDGRLRGCVGHRNGVSRTSQVLDARLVGCTAAPTLS